MFDLWLKNREFYDRQTARGWHSKQASSPASAQRWECERGDGNGELLVGVSLRVSAGGQKGAVWTRGWSRAWRGSWVPWFVFIITS